MVGNLLLILILSIAAVQHLKSQTISARAFTDKTAYEIGDYINYTIEISHSQDLRVLKPSLSDYAKGIEVLKIDDPTVEESKGGKKIIYRFIISKYDSADVVLPSIPINYQLGNDTTSYVAYTNSVQFTVSSLQVNTSDDIKDIKPPITIPIDLLFLVFIIALIVIVLLLLLYYYRKAQKTKQKLSTRKRIYIIPPHVKALTELNALEEKKLWQQGLLKEYHSQITEIIRRYFEERFQILALESSTSEIMTQLNRVILPENIYKTINEFLNNADLVKFAKYKPLASINEEMMRQAISIVENTVPVKTEIVIKEKINV